MMGFWKQFVNLFTYTRIHVTLQHVKNCLHIINILYTVSSDPSNRNEPQHDKTNKMTCAPSEDSDQTGQSDQIRVFAVRMKKPCIVSYPLNAQRRLWSVGGCSDWSESSFGAHVILLVLACCGANVVASGSEIRLTEQPVTFKPGADDDNESLPYEQKRKEVLIRAWFDVTCTQMDINYVSRIK